MRKITLALAALIVSVSGCRLFRDDDRPSRHYRYEQPAIHTGMQAGPGQK